MAFRASFFGGFCSLCSERTALRATDTDLTCTACRQPWTIPWDQPVSCPNTACRNVFSVGSLRTERCCPNCRQPLDDGAPIQPLQPNLSFVGRILPWRGARLDARYQTARADFELLYRSWCADSLGEPVALADDWLSQSRRSVRERHARMLKQHEGDVEKNLYNVMHDVARTDRSWDINRSRRELTDSLLSEMLGSQQYPHYSEGTLARCAALLPSEYSWAYLATELERQVVQSFGKQSPRGAETAGSPTARSRR